MLDKLDQFQLGEHETEVDLYFKAVGVHSFTIPIRVIYVADQKGKVLEIRYAEAALPNMDFINKSLKHAELMLLIGCGRKRR